MSAIVIDGRASAVSFRRKIARETEQLKSKHGITPGLATVLVGNDPASEVYVRNKNKTAESLGFKSVHIPLPESVLQDVLNDKIRALNDDPAVHGILVQLPLPEHLDESRVFDTLAPAKDVDSLTPTNAGLLLSGRAILMSCTPAGVMRLISEYAGDITGREAVVLGRSLLFGKPAAQLLLAANATVTMAHSRSRDLPSIIRRADILVCAIGNPEFVKAGWIKPGAVVIDVGINRIDAEEGKSKIVGDVDYDNAKEIAHAITPVPGGVGAMTIICLMHNTLIAACIQNGLAVPSLS